MDILGTTFLAGISIAVVILLTSKFKLSAFVRQPIFFGPFWFGLLN